MTLKTNLILSSAFKKETGSILFAKIAYTFNKTRRSVRNQHFKSLNPTQPEGRPPSLTNNEIITIIDNT